MVIVCVRIKCNIMVGHGYLIALIIVVCALYELVVLSASVVCLVVSFSIVSPHILNPWKYMWHVYPLSAGSSVCFGWVRVKKPQRSGWCAIHSLYWTGEYGGHFWLAEWESPNAWCGIVNCVLWYALYFLLRLLLPWRCCICLAWKMLLGEMEKVFVPNKLHSPTRLP